MSSDRTRFAVRLALFYATSFAVSGAYMPFFPVWLKAKGLDPAWIGIVMTMPTLARLSAVPLVTRLAERRRAIHEVLCATAMLTCAGFALLAAMPNAAAITAMILVTACVWTPTAPLTDAYALHGVAIHHVDYGPIRLWGSVAYVVGVFAAGLVATAIAPIHLIWFIVALTVLNAVMSMLIEPLGRADQPSTIPANRFGLLSSWPFLIVVAAAALIQGSHAAYYVFSAIAWEAQGFSSVTIGTLWSICVVAEIVLFAISPRLDITYSSLLVAGGIGGAVRWVATASEPPLAVLGGVQLLHALSFGATHLGMMGLLARLVPRHATASAQGFVTAGIGMVTAVASITCGRLFAAYGQSIYLGMAGMALGGGMLMLVAHRRVEAAAGSDGR